MSCKNCGFCCLNISLRYPNQPQVLEWLKARGAKIRIDGENGKSVEALLNHACPQLTSSGNRWKCVLHKRGKPKACTEAICPKGNN